MKLVDLRDGKLELRWTWLPYWLAAGPSLHNEMETWIKDAVLINGMPMTEESLARIEAFILRFIEARFKIDGLVHYLAALRFVHEPV